MDMKMLIGFLDKLLGFGPINKQDTCFVWEDYAAALTTCCVLLEYMFDLNQNLKYQQQICGFVVLFPINVSTDCSKWTIRPSTVFSELAMLAAQVKTYNCPAWQHIKFNVNVILFAWTYITLTAGNIIIAEYSSVDPWHYSYVMWTTSSLW